MKKLPKIFHFFEDVAAFPREQNFRLFYVALRGIRHHQQANQRFRVVRAARHFGEERGHGIGLRDVPQPAQIRLRVFRHFDEAESSRTAGLPVQCKTCACDRPVSFKHASEFIFRHGVRHVSDIDFHEIPFPGLSGPFCTFPLHFVPVPNLYGSRHGQEELCPADLSERLLRLSTVFLRRISNDERCIRNRNDPALLERQRIPELENNPRS